MMRCRGNGHWLHSRIRKLNVCSRSLATTERILTILSLTGGTAYPQAGRPAMLFQGIPRPTAARDKQEGESAMISLLMGLHSHTPRRLTFPLSFTQEIASVVKGSFRPRHDLPRLVGVCLRSYYSKQVNSDPCLSF